MKNATKAKKDFGCVSVFEVRTGGGGLVEVRCRPEDVKAVKACLETDVATVRAVCTERTSTVQGSLGTWTRFRVKQHKYAGGGHPGYGGFIELLEIKDPPDERCGFVIYTTIESPETLINGFYEFKTLADAKTAWKKNRNRIGKLKNLPDNAPGFIRHVNCGNLIPWFYAVGDQHLIGDVVHPDVINEDPIFRFRRKFLVTDYDGLTTIKICMGKRKMTKMRCHSDGFYNRETITYWRVYWDDASHTDVYGEELPESVRPLDESEEWIDEAMRQFRAMLAGRNLGFDIPFLDGSLLTVKLKDPNPRGQKRAGRYFAKIRHEDGTTKEGWFDFEPSPKLPTVLDSLIARSKKPIKRIMELKLEKGEKKKWAGVFSRAPKKPEQPQD